MRENNVNVQVYSSCNCSCNFCGFTDKCHNKIDPEFVINYINEHPNINLILLTGGEPTFAINECAKIIQGLDVSEKKVVLQTNGWWGNNDDIKQVIKDNPPTCVHLSVDSEKQKVVKVETAIKAYEFLIENNIQVFVVNHHEETNEAEFEYYKTLFPNIKYGRIVKDNGQETDCGVALLATNTVGRLDIKGWR